MVASPLRRAQETAAVIAADLGLGVDSDDRLVELDYGEWDEHSFADLPAEEVARWQQDPTFAPPAGESLLAVGERVASFCRELIDGDPVIAVSHVSPIKAAAIWAMDADPRLAWRMHLDVASITRIGAPRGMPCLLGFNDTAHLA